MWAISGKGMRHPMGNGKRVGVLVVIMGVLGSFGLGYGEYVCKIIRLQRQ